jgi:hypothetical protein
MAVAIDTLAYARKLREAGFSERQAEGQAEALAAAMTDTLATKQDLSELGSRVDVRFAHVDTQFAQVDARFAQIDARFDRLDQRLVEMERRFEYRMDARIADLERRITLRMLAGIGAVSALVKML